MAESRRKFGKVNNVQLLREILDKYDLFSPVPNRASLIVNNTNLSAAETAKQIAAHFNLL